MELKVVRFSSQKDSTNGLLFDMTKGTKFLCYTLEDQHQKNKVYGETRVPKGRYRVTLRQTGGFHKRYAEKFGTPWHKGMLWVRDVPGFEYILIHIGNDDDDTAGCLLVGDMQASNLVRPNGWVSHSTNAYKAIYPYIADTIASGEEVWITYEDLD